MLFVTRAAVAALLVGVPMSAAGAEKIFDLPPFSAISISSGIDAVVTVTAGAAQSVVATSPRQEEIDELQLEVRDGRLHAWTDWNLLELFDFADGDRQTVITISVPALSAATADSGADIDVSGIGGDAVTLNASSGSDIDARAAAGKVYDLNASSGARLNVEGTCVSATIVVSSGATARADRLLCADVDANASSGSDADVYTSGSFKGEASSGSDVTVYGSPTSTEVNSSSGGDIHIN
jgi:hypothetical protein